MYEVEQTTCAQSIRWRQPVAAFLMLVCLAALGWATFWAAPSASAAALSQQGATPSLQELKNAEYRNLNTVTGTVKLSDGSFVDATAGMTVTLTDFYAIGDISGDGAADAAVILATTSNDGTVYYSLAGLINDNGDFKPAGVVLLGDRVRIDQLSIANGLVTVEYARRRPTDAECCPSLQTTGTYTLRRNLLVPQQTKAYGLLFPYRQGELYGYANVLGETVIEPQFVQASDFSNGLAAVSYDGQNTGYINQLGELVIEPRFSYGGPFSQGIAIVGIPGVDVDKPFLSAFIDRAGQFVFGDMRFAAAEPFSEGLAAVSFDGERFGYINLLGETAIEPQFTQAESFHEGLAPALFGGQYGFIDRAGKFVIPPQYEAAEPFVDGLAQIVLGGKTGYINQRGGIVIEPVYDYGSDFHEGRALVALDGQQLYINEDGQVIIDLPNLTQGSDFSEGLAAVALDNRFGYVDLQGNTVISPQFTYAGNFFNGMASFETNDSWGVLNSLGEILLETPKFVPPVAATTDRVAFVPIVPAETRAGFCSTNSAVLGLANAWRCTVDNQEYDPCLVADDGETVVCNSSPTEEGSGFRLELTKPLPKPAVTTKMSSPIWQFRLEDGTTCTLLANMKVEIDGKPVTHVCSDRQVILGGVDQSGKQWTAEKAAVVNDDKGNFKIESAATVNVLTAWEPAAP
jgi:hypothetical protein